MKRPNEEKIALPVKYIHIRRVSANGLSVLPNGGATIAYTDTIPSEHEPQEILCAVAFCHPNDNFSKFLGRKKATGQLARLVTGRVEPDDERFFRVYDTSARLAAEEVAERVRLLGNYDG